MYIELGNSCETARCVRHSRLDPSFIHLFVLRTRPEEDRVKKLTIAERATDPTKDWSEQTRGKRWQTRETEDRTGEEEDHRERSLFEEPIDRPEAFV